MPVIIRSYVVEGDLSSGYDFEYTFRTEKEARECFNGIAGEMFLGKNSVVYVTLTEVNENRTTHFTDYITLATFGGDQ